ISKPLLFREMRPGLQGFSPDRRRSRNLFCPEEVLPKTKTLHLQNDGLQAIPGSAQSCCGADGSAFPDEKVCSAFQYGAGDRSKKTWKRGGWDLALPAPAGRP